jgi:hypothetical protein
LKSVQAFFTGCSSPSILYSLFLRGAPYLSRPLLIIILSRVIDISSSRLIISASILVPALLALSATGEHRSYYQIRFSGISAEQFLLSSALMVYLSKCLVQTLILILALCITCLLLNYDPLFTMSICGLFFSERIYDEWQRFFAYRRLWLQLLFSSLTIICLPFFLILFCSIVFHASSVAISAYVILASSIASLLSTIYILYYHDSLLPKRIFVSLFSGKLYRNLLSKSSIASLFVSAGSFSLYGYFRLISSHLSSNPSFQNSSSLYIVIQVFGLLSLVFNLVFILPNRSKLSFEMPAKSGIHLRLVFFSAIYFLCSSIFIHTVILSIGSQVPGMMTQLIYYLGFISLCTVIYALFSEYLFFSTSFIPFSRSCLLFAVPQAFLIFYTLTHLQAIGRFFYSSILCASIYLLIVLYFSLWHNANNPI